MDRYAICMETRGEHSQTGDISALRCGLIGSCSSTFQYSSLGGHLGVTDSPQPPLLAGYVTLPVDSRSPPHGLMSFHSEGHAFFSCSTSFLVNAFRTICASAVAKSRRTIANITYPGFIRRMSFKILLEKILRYKVRSFRLLSCFFKTSSHLSRNTIFFHYPAYSFSGTLLSHGL